MNKRKDGKQMGYINETYTDILREADRIITGKDMPDETATMKELKERLKKQPHDKAFYFHCGMAAANSMSKQMEDGCCMNPCAEYGLAMFTTFIDLEDEMRILEDRRLI